MKKSWLEFYALAVCFFTVGCFAIFTGLAVWNGVSMAAPAFTMHNHQWSIHQTDESFRKSLLLESRRYDKEGVLVDAPPKGSELTAMRKASLAQELQSERRSAFQDLLQNLIVMLIDLLLFIAHWKVARYARNELPG